jgi:hypothetical protein
MTITRDCGPAREQTTDVTAARLHPYERFKALPRGTGAARNWARALRKPTFFPVALYGWML